MKNIVIFGKNGQVANAILKKFESEKNFKITSYSSADIDFSKLNNLQHFLNYTIPSKIDFIINCSGYTNVDKAEDDQELCDLVNHQAVEILAKFCKEKNIILIHYSTDYVFDGSGNKPFLADNTKNLQPLNFYGVTKLRGEQAIQKSDCEHLILRISWVYDNRTTSHNFVNTIKKLAKEKEILSIINDQIGSPTSADFVALRTIEIIKKIVETNSNFAESSLNSDKKNFQKILHISNENFMSWFDFAGQIVDEMKKNNEEVLVKKIIPIKTSEYKTRAIRPLNSRLKNSDF
jgi:dTDP-4-dehydrorhamnose reductase